MSNNGYMPASPVKGCDGKFIDCTDDNMQWLKQCAPSLGLSKREKFSMAAMQGFISNSSLSGAPEECAEQSLRYADALLAELEK